MWKIDYMGYGNIKGRDVALLRWEAKPFSNRGVYTLP
jgi:hypothetical protein